MAPLTLYGVNEEMEFIPQVSQYLYLDYSSLTDNHWSIEKRTKRNSFRRVEPQEEYAEYLVVASRSAFLGENADILWLLQLARV